MQFRRTPALPWLIALVAAIAAAACGGTTTSTNVTGPSDVRCQASITNSSTSFAAAGGTGSLTVNVARECSWSAASQTGWIVLTSPASGQGEGTVTYRVAENGDPVTRRGAVVVSEHRVEVAQEAAPCRFGVSPAASSVSAQGGEVGVGVQTHEVCSWTAVSETPGVAVSPGSGRGHGQVQVSVPPNTSPTARGVAVVVAGHRLEFQQAGAGQPPPDGPAPPPNPNPPPPPPPDGGDPIPVSPIRLDGPVSNLSGTCPDLRFQLRGATVYTHGGTRWDDGSCDRLRNGRRVEVRGHLMSDGTVRADRVEFD